jgi:hypothetical protein
MMVSLKLPCACGHDGERHVGRCLVPGCGCTGFERMSLHHIGAADDDDEYDSCDAEELTLP